MSRKLRDALAMEISERFDPQYLEKALGKMWLQFAEGAESHYQAVEQMVADAMARGELEQLMELLQQLDSAFPSPELRKLLHPPAGDSRPAEPSDPPIPSPSSDFPPTPAPTSNHPSRKQPLTAAKAMPKKLQQALLDDLNRVLQSQDYLYQPQLFSDVALAPELRRQAAQKPSGDRRILCNRALLEAAYPRELVQRSLYARSLDKRKRREPLPLQSHAGEMPGTTRAESHCVAPAIRRRPRHRWVIAGLAVLLLIVAALAWSLRRYVPAVRDTRPDVVRLRWQPQSEESSPAEDENPLTVYSDDKTGKAIATKGKLEIINALWDISLLKFDAFPDIATLAFSRHSGVIAAISRQHRVALWDLKQGKPLGEPWQFQGIAVANELHKIIGASKGDEQQLWAVGARGTLLFSADGGQRWELREIGASEDFYDIHAGTPLVIVGSEGLLLFSDDGWQWQRQQRFPFVDWHALHATDDGKRLWLVGSNGRIAHSADGGEDWQFQRSGTERDLHDIDGSGEHLWIVGDAGTLLYSMDNGKHWQQRSIGSDRDLAAVCCSDDGRRVFVAGAAGTFAYSPDGGNSWTHPYLDTVETLRDIAFAAGCMWLVGDGGSLFYSPDAGANWPLQIQGSSEKCNTAWVDGAGTKLVVGGQHGVAAIHGFPGEIRCLAISSDGKTLACGTDEALLLLPMDAGNLLAHRDFRGMTGIHYLPLGKDGASPTALAFSPDNSTLAVAKGKDIELWQFGAYESVQYIDTKGREIKLWNPTIKEKIATISRHQATVTHLAFNSDGKLLGSAAEDGTVSAWNTNHHEVVYSYRNNRKIRGIFFSEEKIGLVDERGNMVFDDSGKEGLSLGMFDSTVDVLRIAVERKQTKLIATIDRDNQLKIWHSSFNEYQEIARRSIAITRSGGLAFYQDTLLYSSANTLYLWDIAKAKLEKKLFATRKQYVRPIGWPKQLWQDCWNGEYIDFTAKKWSELEAEQQGILAGHYQQWYAQRMDLPIEKEFVAGGATFSMVLIPPGKFLMGSPETERDRGSPKMDRDRGQYETQHPVIISKAFWMAKYEITQGQWTDVTGEQPWQQGKPREQNRDHPASNISWYDINDKFVAKLGNGWNLPTEAQWEYACRAGTLGRFYWGEDESQVKLYANTAFAKDGFVEIAPVGKFRPNGFHLHDMNGNLYEWCRDGYGEYPTQLATDPIGANINSPYRVFRGGDWSVDMLRWLRSAYRHRNAPDRSGAFIGGRVAIEVMPKLKITNEVSIRQIFLHRLARFTITLKNEGDAAALDVNLIDDIPDGLEFIESDPNGVLQASGDEQKKRIFWQLGDIAPGATQIITLDVRGESIGVFRNTATAYSKGKSFEAFADIRVDGVSAMHFSIYDTQDPVEVDKQTIYVIEARNEGTKPCTNVRLTNEISSKMEFVSAQGPTDFTQEGNKVVFALYPLLKPGDRTVYKIVCRAIREGLAKNRAILQCDQFDDTIIKEEVTSVGGLSAMHLSMYDTGDPVEVDKQTTYVIEARSEGIIPCTNVRLTNEISSQMEFVSAQGPTKFTREGNNVVFAPNPTLKPGDKLVYKIVCRAIQEGLAKNRAIFQFDQIDDTIIKEETTSIYK